MRHPHPLISRARSLEALVANLAFQDWCALAFHLYMWLRVTLAPDSADASMARRLAGFLLALTIATLVLVRGEVMKAGWPRTLLYRVTIAGAFITSYFELRWLLPALQPRLVDAQLQALDVALLGTSPAVLLEALNRPAVTEWFSFFYYSYFYLLALLVLPHLFGRRGTSQRHILLGAVVICTVGHFMYTLVPGKGPVASPWLFEGPIEGGFWWSNVKLAVDTAGAQLDIFPSLHTAYPTFFTIAAFTLRNESRILRYAWPVIGFFAVNIIIATMLLRWHWGIDVVAGLVLAVAANQVSMWVSSWEALRGSPGDERQRVWEPLWPSDHAPERRSLPPQS